jgi:anti-sigma factor RsiW
MKRPDVDTLMAYANGGLTPDERRRIERFLEGDSEVRRLIETFRRTQAPAPTPSKARGFKGAAGIAPPPPAAGRSNRGTALAVSLVVIAALGLGAFLLGQDEESQTAVESPIAPGRLSSIDALSATLTRLASGTPGMAGDRALAVLTTFRDARRRPCREFEVSDTSPTASHIIAVACQDGGAWWIEGSAWLVAGGSNSSAGFAPSSSGRADPLAGLLKQLGAGVALEPEEEAALIARNWQEEAAK